MSAGRGITDRSALGERGGWRYFTRIIQTTAMMRGRVSASAPDSTASLCKRFATAGVAMPVALVAGLERLSLREGRAAGLNRPHLGTDNLVAIGC